MVAFGVNVQPLLTFGSISTVAVGFAAQSTMQNVVSALQIVSSCLLVFACTCSAVPRPSDRQRLHSHTPARILPLCCSTWSRPSPRCIFLLYHLPHTLVLPPPPQYSSRPFIIGDRIQLKTLSGRTIVAGGLGVTVLVQVQSAICSRSTGLAGMAARCAAQPAQLHRHRSASSCSLRV